MFTQVTTLGLLVTTAMALQAFSPVHNFDAMLPRDALTKRQGYYPTTHDCGSGDTCAEACGTGYEQCASDVGLVCFRPDLGYTCCTDGTGNSCRDGYYCSSDRAGTTYCCPEDMSLSDCAAYYSLTVSLVEATGSVVAPTSAVPATTTPIHVSSMPPSYGTGSVSYETASSGMPVVPTGNGTYTTTPPPEFTGAAARVAGAGMAVLAGAAGVAGLL